MNGHITVADLFCGAGGLSAGLRAAGCCVVYAADCDRAAVQSYRLNFPHGAALDNLHWDSVLPEVDVVVGGPPCQGFSSAGKRSPSDARNSLVAVFAHLVARHRPQAFLFENVEGFLTGDDGKWVVDLLDPLIAAGYCIHMRKVNAANFGIPQHRKRVIALGGLGWNPGFPSVTHCATGTPGALAVGRGLPACPSALEALHGLPPAVPRERGQRPRCLPLADHDYRAPRGLDAARVRTLLPGQTMKDLPEHLWHDTYRRRAHRRVMDGTPSERRGGAPAGLRRLAPNQPSKAITSGANSEFIHPTEDRPLTLRECARLQTFPDDFRFAGTLAEKAAVVANAVPPRLAELFGRHLLTAMRERDGQTTAPGLMSFFVTNATAMSPALKRTVEDVERRYAPTGQRSLLDQWARAGFLSARETGASIVLQVGGESLVVDRDQAAAPVRQHDPMPDDADDVFPGV